LCELIGLRRHDEIVAMQPFDLVSPPLHGYTAPLRDDQRMMALFFRDRADLVRECERLDKLLGPEGAFQPLNPVDFLNLPIRHLRLKLLDLSIGNGRLAGPASHTA
jgi:hypothetical protein